MPENYSPAQGRTIEGDLGTFTVLLHARWQDALQRHPQSGEGSDRVSFQRACSGTVGIPELYQAPSSQGRGPTPTSRAAATAGIRLF